MKACVLGKEGSVTACIPVGCPAALGPSTVVEGSFVQVAAYLGHSGRTILNMFPFNRGRILSSWPSP